MGVGYGDCIEQHRIVLKPKPAAPPSSTSKPDSTVKSPDPAGFGERFLAVPSVVVDGGGLQEASKQGMLTERKPKGEFR